MQVHKDHHHQVRRADTPVWPPTEWCVVGIQLLTGVALYELVSMQFRRSRPDIVSGCCVLGLEYDMPPNSTSTGGEILQRGRTSDQSVLKVAAGLIDLYTERRETDPCPANS